jgi:hypothetical protein
MLNKLTRGEKWLGLNLEILFGFILARANSQANVSPYLDKVNDNAYKVDLPGDYNVSATFNVNDLTPYLDDNDDSDLRTNHFQPEADDVHHGNYNPSCKAKTNMQEDSDGPMTRARAKQLQRALRSQIGMIEAASELKISNQFEIGSRMFICLQLEQFEVIHCM